LIDENQKSKEKKIFGEKILLFSSNYYCLASLYYELKSQDENQVIFDRERIEHLNDFLISIFLKREEALTLYFNN